MSRGMKVQISLFLEVRVFFILYEPIEMQSSPPRRALPIRTTTTFHNSVVLVHIHPPHLDTWERCRRFVPALSLLLLPPL